MNELALFAGAGGGILGGVLCGFRCVCAVEIDPYCRAVLAARQDDGTLAPFPLWDDVRTFDGQPWRGIVDVVSGGFPCFAAGTLILARKGFVPIETLCAGDEVCTHLGRWRPVTSTMRRDGAALWRVQGTGILDTITTAEHPYLTRQREFKWDSENRTRKRTFHPAAWTPVQGLAADRFHGCVLPCPEDHDRDAAWWWLVGRYLADGWRVARKGRKNGRVVICCNRKEREILASGILAAGYHATEAEERTVIKFHITKGDFYAALEDFGHRAEGKRLPASALCLDAARADALFSGWIGGDGWRNKSSKLWSGTTVSPALALGMAIVAQRAYGRVASVHTARVSARTTIEGRSVNQRTQYSVRICDRNRVSFVDGDYGWRPIKSAAPTGILGAVYNISVAEDESYVANGAIVHNCQDISVAGKGAGIGGAKSGLWREMARIIGEVRPRYVLVENSPALVGRGLGTVLGDLSSMGFAARWGVLGAHHTGAPHYRDRLWVVAYAHSLREPQPQGAVSKERGWAGDSGEDVAYAHADGRSIEANGRSGSLHDELRLHESSQPGRHHEQPGPDRIHWWGAEPDVGRVAHGVASRVDRLRALGNGQVPAVVKLAWDLLGPGGS